jgi:hypothetical protein
MKKVWRIKGHDDDNEEEDDIDNDSMGLETSLGTVKDKQSLVGKQKCYECGKTGHRSAKFLNKKKKGQMEKAGVATEASIKRTKSKCSHCGKQVTRKRTAGGNTHTKPHLGDPWKLQENSWRRSSLCATLHKTRCSTSCQV